MGNTQKDATVLVLARLAALRASTPRFITRILAIVHHVTFTVAGQMLTTVNTLRNRFLLTLRDHIVPATRALAARAGQTSVARSGRTAAVRAAGTPAARATGAAAASAASVIAGRSARMARALPARARIPAAAAGVVTIAVVAAIAVAGVGAPGASMAAARSQTALTPAAAAPAAQRPADSAVAAPVQKAHAVTGHATRHAPVTHAPARPAVNRHTTARHAPARPASKQHASVTVKHTTPARHVRHVRHVRDLSTWHAITEAAAGHRHGGSLAPQQKLLPAGLYGSQAAMAITPARAANAEVITHEALRLHMGIRSAVIAVATAMQESTLENLGYGDRDSLGLFQQRPSAGWGSPAQITNRVYAADAFLHALATYQHADPAWASQPLWEAAQGVQRSAFPYAYAQWEDQAAHIVAVATRHLL
jgi:hypothetical protein